MKQESESDFDDSEMGFEDDAEVEAFLRTIERSERKARGRAAWREIERRRERRALVQDLGDYYDD